MEKNREITLRVKEVESAVNMNRMMEQIYPYTERPAAPDFDQTITDKRLEIKATELFSSFTADIIKEETLFFR